MDRFEPVHLAARVELDYDEVCGHWAWRIGDQEWSDCFDSRGEALTNAQQELEWRVTHS